MCIQLFGRFLFHLASFKREEEEEKKEFLFITTQRGEWVKRGGRLRRGIIILVSGGLFTFLKCQRRRRRGPASLCSDWDQERVVYIYFFYLYWILASFYDWQRFDNIFIHVCVCVFKINIYKKKDWRIIMQIA